MALSINTAASAMLSATAISPSKLATLKQPQSSTAASDFPLKIEKSLQAPKTPEEKAKAQERQAIYNQAISTPLRLGQDASNIANALISTMQSVVLERPDLANAQFGFKSDNGTIQVVSDTLSQRDKTWLQNKLNGNSRLVQAVKTFHDHTVRGYADWAKLDGQPLTQSQTAAVNKKADNQTNFMQLFERVATETKKNMANDAGTYHTPDGAKIDFSTQPSNAISFLSFMQSADAVANGATTDIPNVTLNGVTRTIHGHWKENIFANDAVMPHFAPPLGIKSLGINETA